MIHWAKEEKTQILYDTNKFLGELTTYTLTPVARSAAHPAPAEFLDLGCI
jgi:hypothetical protein